MNTDRTSLEKETKSICLCVVISRFLFPYQTWIKIREESKDEYGEKLCYCGHTHKCTCSNPDKKLFKESVNRGSIILWDNENGWKNGL